jgi:processing peptidase subunit alpha
MLKYTLNRSLGRVSAACRPRSRVCVPVSAGRAAGRAYHTYPDPEETPVTTSARSEAVRTVTKTGQEFDAMHRYDMNKPFAIPGEISEGGGFTQQPKTMVTTLANGLTVATQDMPGLMCSIALLVKTGSTAEIQSAEAAAAANNTGTVQMLECTAFGDTPTLTQEELHGKIEQLGGIVQCVSQRESIAFFVDVFKNKVDESLSILADSVLNALLTEEELEAGKDSLQYMRDAMPPEILSKDAVIMAAFRGQAMGNTHYCPAERIQHITRDHLIDFKNKYFVPKNCIISASAVDHETFVKQVENAFANFQSTAAVPPPEAPTAYTGGLYTETRVLKEEFVRCTVGFESGGWTGDNFVTACVLQTLLGGGSSFSAGGPGKGMYTRLYREVMNRYGWVESAESFISCHRDVGLLGIDGSCRADGIGPLIQVILDQMIQLTVKEVDDVELSRAKNMLKSMMFMQLESRLITCEDIAKQIMVYGERKDTASLCAEIDAVTKKDILNLSRSLLTHDPSVAIIGHDVSGAPSYEAVKQFADTYKAEIWSKHDLQF